MNAKITCFPIGNADSTLIQTETGKTILWDYADMRGEKHCDLPKELNKLNPNDYYDVACFTHGDEDHVKGMSEHLYLEFAEKYQKGDRKKIKDLWIPAALLIESRNDLCEDATALQAEARYRFLKLKKGIKVFSKPEALKDWVEKEGVKLTDVQHLIVDAGQNVPGWSKAIDGVEFFIHSPFKGHVDKEEVIDRNAAAILVQSIFGNKVETKFILGGDADSDILKDVVRMSKYKGNADKLKWDILHLFHHCSYKALNKNNKGKSKTDPISEVQWLMETQGQKSCLIISPSDSIPTTETDQPPHFQAANYYKENVCGTKEGRFIVLMDHPKKEKPEPLTIYIDDNGFNLTGYTSLSDAEKRKAATKIASSSVTSGNWTNV